MNRHYKILKLNSIHKQEFHQVFDKYHSNFKTIINQINLSASIRLYALKYNV